MKQRQINSKKGFTIIEVVLVLAIAALIFLMVFIALPALGRSQRDTQRKEDLSRMATAITNYQSNNGGSNPSMTAGPASFEGKKDYTEGQISGFARGGWQYFYAKYLLVQDGTKDKFADPDGTPYGIDVVACTTASKKNGDDCDPGVQKRDMTWTQQAGENKHKIRVVTNAACDGETAVYSTGERKVALLYKLEQGGVLCQNV